MQAEIGVYGLGTMGQALALNLADQGVRVAVTNREADWIDPFLAEAGPLAARMTAAHDLPGFVNSLATPRLILFMIPSGAPLDEMLAQIRPLLSAGDTLIDAGNADFHDTRRRAAALAQEGLHYVGMGVSGGAAGARHGPSLMVGGPAQSWDRLAPLLQRIAARYAGDPCVAHLGPDGAGHFVKTVHNGIEYADMQMLAEVYGLLRDGSGWDAGKIAGAFAGWQAGPLDSYLLDITVAVLRTADPATGAPMVDMIRDAAGQKGTGRWTVIEALKLGQSVSVIAAAVDARNWSSAPDLRAALTEAYTTDAPGNAALIGVPTESLEQALLAGRLIAHAQGFGLLSAASAEYGWNFDKARIAEIWRAGCIIRAAVLDDIAAAFRHGAPRDMLVLDASVQTVLAEALPHLRRVVGAGLANGIAMPALAAALVWADSLMRVRGTANLIQAQRDVFGRHGFERLDRPGKAHADWDL